MLRSAWKQCRSWPHASDAKCAGLRRQPLAGRMDRLAVASEHRGHRILGEPVDLEVGVEPAQLVDDGEVAADVAEADRRRDVQDLLDGGCAPRVQTC